VDFAEQADGSFLMTVTARDRTKQTVSLQDRNQVSEVATLLNETGRRNMAANDKEQKRLDDQWRRGKRRRALKVNIAYGRTASGGGTGAGAAAAEEPIPQTPEELFGQSVGPAFQPSAGGAAQRPAASRSANRKKSQPSVSKKSSTKKKPAPAKKSPARRRRPTPTPLGILDDVIATITEAVETGAVDTDAAVNAIQAQIDALQKQIDRLQGR
jgi:hypothetical protein